MALTSRIRWTKAIEFVWKAVVGFYAVECISAAMIVNIADNAEPAEKANVLK